MLAAKIRQRIASAVLDSVAEHGQRRVGSWIGHDQSTVSRWGGDLGQWDAEALIDLIVHDPSIWALFSDIFSAAPHSDQPTNSEIAVIKGLASTGSLVNDYATALQDNQIDNQEREELIKHTREEIRNLSNVLAALEQKESSRAR